VSHPVTEKPPPKAVANGGGATYFVYVLRNRAGILYTGIALDVAARCVQHNDGRGARFTRGRGPWVVIHLEGPLPKGDALRRELRIKADRRFKAVLKARVRAKRAQRSGAALSTAP
jgi:putative endonuclease